MLRRSKLFWLLALLIVVAIGLLAVFLSALDDFDLSGYNAHEISFEHSGHAISGTLHLPDADAPPTVLIVHGDGPADRYLGGALLPFIRTLLDNGIAVFSWDKPGVGSSEGNWLTYSMDDRAELAAAAMSSLGKRSELNGSEIGLLGFSQAGWVLPKLAQEDDEADFLVLVGGAVNWQEQGQYYTRQRLAAEGLDAESIEKEIRHQAVRNRELLSPDLTYEDYLKAEVSDAPMSNDRYQFVRRNWQVDASQELMTATKPFLTVHGRDDLNVDPLKNSARYQSLLSANNPANRALLIEDAGHALLRKDLFNYQTEKNRPFWSEIAFLTLGRDAYAPGALDAVVAWIKVQADADPKTD